MEQFSFAYQQIDSTIWAFASSLLMISLFFKFNRFWSVRNFDLLLIILLAPSLIMVHKGLTMSSLPATNEQASAILASHTGNTSPAPQTISKSTASPAAWQSESTTAPEPSEDFQAGVDLQRRGFVGLFIVGAIYLIRMLLDPLLVRRPLLDPNLSLGGLIFLGICLMFLLFANIVNSKPTPEEMSMVKSTISMVKREAADEADTQYLRKRGPGYQMLFLVAVISVFSDVEDTDSSVAGQQVNLESYILVLKMLAIISQSLIVAGLIFFAIQKASTLGSASHRYI